MQLSVKADSYRAEGNNGLTTKNSSLNSILSSYGALEYKQLFKGAKTPGLTEVYAIEFTGNAANFKNTLASSGFFNNVEIVPYAQTLCSSSYPMNDPYLMTELDLTTWTASQHPIGMMNLKCAWDITSGDENITIAIIDSEFDTNHEDLQGKFINPVTILPNTGYYGTHGTFTFGIALANVNNGIGLAGSGNKTRGAGYKVDGGSSLPQCIWQAYLDGHKIINVSWTVTGISVATAQEMTQNGVNLVLAAGNTPNAECHLNLADIPGVILVSGHDWNGSIGGANHARNSKVDIVAPSTEIFSTSPGNVQKYGVVNGTSLAAPLTCGVIALMKAANPCLSPADIENLLKASAAPVSDASTYSGLFGAGRVDAYAAVLAAQNQNSINQITNNTTFNTDRNIYGDVIIYPGKTLTVTAKVKMGCNNRIIVRPNAKLIIDGGEITRLDNGRLWSGVELWGNKNATSQGYFQGTLEMKNNAKISYAINGVRNWSEENHAQGGGIIKVSNSTFLNCRRAVELNDYPNYTYWTDINAGLSNCSFSNTSFLSDDVKCLYSNNDGYLYGHINGTITGTLSFPYQFSSWNTKDGILIKNCTFKSTLTDDVITNAPNRGIALHLAESGGLVTDNIFEGYARGFYVSSISGSPTHNVKFYKNSIQKTRNGILVAGGTNTDIRGNTITNMPKYSNNVINAEQNIGIFVDNSTNTFIGCGNNISYDQQIGFINYNSGDEPWGIELRGNGIGPNTVTKNTLKRLFTAVQFDWGNKKNTTYSYNDMTGEFNYYAIAIGEQGGVQSNYTFGEGCNASGIYAKKIAGNKFNTTTSRIYNHPSNSFSIPYYYKSGVSNLLPTNTQGNWSMIPCSSSGFFMDECTIVDVNPGGPVLAQKLEKYNGLIAEGERFSPECEELVGDIIRTYNDLDDLNGLIRFLEDDNTTNADIMLLPIYIETANYTNYDRLKVDLDENVLGQDAKRAFGDYYDIIKRLKTDGRTIFELQDQELSTIRNVAHGDYFEVTGYAKSLLDFIGDEVWVHEASIIDVLADRPGVAIQAKANDKAIEVYPNPTSDVFTVNINSTIALEDMKLEIVNITGANTYQQKLKDGTQTISLDAKKLNIPTGVYIIKVKAGNKLIGTNKFVIQ